MLDGEERVEVQHACMMLVEGVAGGIVLMSSMAGEVGLSSPHTE